MSPKSVFGKTGFVSMINITSSLHMDRREMKTIIQNCSKTRILRIYSATSKCSGPPQNIAIAILLPDSVLGKPTRNVRGVPSITPDRLWEVDIKLSLLVFACMKFTYETQLVLFGSWLGQTTLPNDTFGAGCSSLTITATHIAVMLPNPVTSLPTIRRWCLRPTVRCHHPIPYHSVVKL